MVKTLDGRLHWAGWIGSLLFHTVLLLFSAFFILQPARFTVKTGKTSTEIELTAEPEPPAVTPPVPLQPISQPIPPIPVVPKLVPIPQQETFSVPKPQPTVPSKPKPLHRNVSTPSSNASKGAAVQAQPDDLHNEPPEYPEESRAAREQGLVMLRVAVTENGDAASVSILRSSGYFRLDQAARRTVQHWKFRAGMAGGIPIRSEIDVPVYFKLQ
jgi:protein TonB